MGRAPIYNLDELGNRTVKEMARPEREVGMTLRDIADFLGVPMWVAAKVIRKLRVDLRTYGSISIPIVRDGMRSLYKLTTEWAVNKPYFETNSKHLNTRMATQLAGVNAVVNDLDLRTADGKAAASLQKSAERLAVDLTDYLSELESLA